MPSRLGRQITFLTVLVLAVAPAGSASAAASDEVLAAAHGNHVWFIRESEERPPAFHLCHLATDLSGWQFKPLTTLAEAPVAIACWAERVWVVFPPRNDTPTAQREVFTLEVQMNPALGQYVSRPAGRMEIAAHLPGGGTLVSVVGSAEGPVALLKQSPGSAPSLERRQGDATSGSNVGPGVDRPMLLRLRQGRWEELSLPDGLTLGRTCFLSVSGFDGSTITLMSDSPTGRDVARCYRLTASNEWVVGEVPLDVRRLRTLINAAGQIAALLGEKSQGELEVVFVRQAGILPIACLDRPLGRWTLVGGGGRLQLLIRDRSGQWAVREIDPLTGQVSALQPLTRQRVTPGSLWQLLLLLSTASFAILLVVLLKPAGWAKVALPKTHRPLPLIPRLVALIIDVVPSGIATILLLRCSVSDLLVMPIVTPQLHLSFPFLMMAGLTILHSAISEAVWGRSLGKVFLGAHVVTCDGSPVGLLRIFIRNVLKLCVLLVPPLVVVSLFNTHLQGLPDIAAGTVVVREEMNDAN